VGVGSFIFSILIWAVGLFILYLVISTAVKDGINKSVVGQYLNSTLGVKDDKKSLLDNDLDNDK
jgi:hypothetical protein